MKNNIVKRNILGINITDLSLQEILEYVAASVKKNDQQLSIMTPNPEMVVYASTHPAFQKILNEASITICDGVGLFLASHFLATAVKERITGVDLMLKLCEYASENAMSIGLLGGRAGVAERTAECLREKLPNLTINFTGSEWEESAFPSKGVDFLFVAYGFPKQEEWIATHLSKLPIKVAMGVGGAFDYISGDVIRAPFFIRLIGFEWLFRLIRQPWRGKRQVALLQFVALVFRQLRSGSRLNKE